MSCGLLLSQTLTSLLSPVAAVCGVCVCAAGGVINKVCEGACSDFFFPFLTCVSFSKTLQKRPTNSSKKSKHTHTYIVTMPSAKVAPKTSKRSVVDNGYDSDEEKNFVMGSATLNRGRVKKIFFIKISFHRERERERERDEYEWWKALVLFVVLTLCVCVS